MGSIFELFAKEKSCRPLANVEGRLARKYKYYRVFLIHNHEALNIISQMELVYHGGDPFTMASVKRNYDDLMGATRKLVKSLQTLSNGRYSELTGTCDRIDEEIATILIPHVSGRHDQIVLPFEALTRDMADLAGTKATNLALIGNVVGLPIPQGFVVTVNAFNRFLEKNELGAPIEEMLSELSADSPQDMESVAKTIQERILKAPVPRSVAKEILKAYQSLEAKTQENIRIAMRSTAVGEDTEASFAGQYVTVLNVGREDILDAYKTVLASKYSPRAILYRLRYGLDDRSTAMCVAGVEMIHANSSGVLYTENPLQPKRPELVISAIWGLGEHLVSGEASPDVYYVNKDTKQISKREIGRKEKRLVSLDDGGTRLEDTPELDRKRPVIDDDMVGLLARYGIKAEEHFQEPQDIEWCVDKIGNLFVLQSRPLHVAPRRPEKAPVAREIQGHPILLSGGSPASGGTAVGKVFMLPRQEEGAIPEDAILVTKTASPDYAKFVGKVKGIITDVGSVASHLSSVAREFSVPTIVNAGKASTTLSDGAWITMVADTATVYQGKVPELAEAPKPLEQDIFESPIRRRMRDVMNRVSPLNLTDPKAPSFSPEGCKTIHDIIRFSHETVMKEMFGLSGDAKESIQSVKMTANIPLSLYFIDLGGGLKENLTTCDPITPDSIESLPMKALWSGLSHPGISWSGTVSLSTGNIMALMTSKPPSHVDSYAIVSGDYVNLSVKFAFHFTNIDILCGDDAEQNYISLQFAGGAGSYYGRFMRINFLGEVLQRLGFTLNLSGDLLEASLKGYESEAMKKTLDQLGRLLASSRSLDLAIPSQTEVGPMIEAFFRGDYNFLKRSKDPLPAFYTPIGDWNRVVENGRTICLQDGSKWGDSISCALNVVMGKMIGAKYQLFLDRIQAHHYFPIAIAKDSEVSGAVLGVKVKPEGGCIDRTGGLAFGIRNVGNYFVLAVDALGNNFALFEFINNRRFKREVSQKKITSGKWHHVSAEISGHTLKGYLDDEMAIQYKSERPLSGHVGLWTKADSITYFEELVIREGKGKRVVSF